MDTIYKTRSTVAELRAWLDQFQPDDMVFIGGTPISGYVTVGDGKDERLFALFDDCDVNDGGNR